MFNLFNKKPIPYIILLILVIFLIEFIFLDSKHIVWTLICGGVSLIAWNYYYRQEYRILFWLGILGVGINLLETIFFRVLLAIPVIWFVIYYFQKIREDKSEPTLLQFGEEVLEESEVLFSNQWFGKQEIGNQPYRWQDINIQKLFGETVIDLRQTVLPKGEPVILLRNLAGKIKIIVPYDVELSIHHSVLIGSVDIFGYGDDQVVNRVIHYQTENYQKAPQRVKVYTTILAGKIEVSRG